MVLEAGFGGWDLGFGAGGRDCPHHYVRFGQPPLVVFVKNRSASDEI
jgi:hypothetical protein